jgi:predicted ArsR family transcriptional regulator
MCPRASPETTSFELRAPERMRFLGTKNELLRLLLEGERSTDDLAVSLGIHPTSVRRHMATLVGEGVVIPRAVRGSRGRPKTVYALTLSGRESLFASYDAVSDSLTRAALERLGGRATRSLFREAAALLAHDLGLDGSRESIPRTLRDLGFQPEIRRGPRAWLVISRNCPVLRLAQKYPEIVCENFHSALLDTAMPGWKSELGQTMARGASHCRHTLVPVSAPR